jgi:transposase-like protein
LVVERDKLQNLEVAVSIEVQKLEDMHNEVTPHGVRQLGAVFKTLYLTIEYITQKWTMPIRDWGQLWLTS